MNEHQAIRELLALAAAGALEETERRRVEKHVAVCESCRREFETWNVYARALGQLPQPAASQDLLLRTQARVLHARPVQAVHPQRANLPLLMLGLSVFGWGVSYLLWFLLHAVSGGELVVLQTNIVRPGVWLLASAALVWTSGAVAAILLAGFRKEWREAL